MKKNNLFLNTFRDIFAPGGTSIPTNYETPAPLPEQETYYSPSSLDFGPWSAVSINVPFDGEKTPGELGVPVNLIPIHNSLRLRSYEAELKMDIVKIITGRFFKWVVGTGLKLQAL